VRWRLPIAILLIALLALTGDLAADVNNPSSVEDFVGCLNQKLQGTKPDIADAVPCLPKGCKFLMTMGPESAQAACALGGCQLPRVILDCPGPREGLRFRPSFLLCPYDSRPKESDVAAGADDEFGINRIEIGEDKTKVDVVKQTGDMCMADIAIHPGKDYQAKTTDDVLSTIIKSADGKITNRGSKACNACHQGPTGGNADLGKPQISNPIDAYTPAEPSNNRNLKPFVIFDHPDRSKLVPDDDKKEDGQRLQVGGVDVKNVTGLAGLCACINTNGGAIETAARTVDPKNPRQANAEFKIDTLKRLCAALLAYENERACGKMPGGTCATARGGGKFLDSRRSVSMLRFQMIGDAAFADPHTVSFTDRDGTLSAYNYLTRKTVDSVTFSSLAVTLLNGDLVNGAWTGDFSVLGLGTGKVTGIGALQPLRFELARAGAALTFKLSHGTTGAVLASGTGEKDRSDFAVFLTEPTP
jgi:hypothetical protein